MPIKSPKNKGAGGEREAAMVLASWAAEVGVELAPKRNLEQTRGGGYDLNDVPGLGVEVKRCETLTVSTWWKQTLRQAEKDGTTPLLMYRQNRRPWRFKVRQFVAIYVGGQGWTVPLDFEMDLENAKRWFQEYIVKCELE